MQTHSADWDAALAGSVQPVVQVDAWYDGAQIATDLPGISGQVTADSTRTVVTTASVSAAAPDTSIVPDGWNAALGCYGTLLHVRAGLRLASGVEWMSLGWLRVDSYSTQEQYQPYQGAPSLVDGGGAYSSGAGVTTSADGNYAPGLRPTLWVPRGSQVPVQCSDLMAAVSDAQFLAPEQPAALTSVVTEIKRLAQAVPGLQVADLSTVTDAAIPASITYGNDRAAAMTQLAAVLGMRPVANADGALDLRPVTPSGAAVWTVSVADSAVPPVADWSRVGDRTGWYNAVVVQGTDPAGNQLVGIATEATGPLRYGGPFGCVPFFVNDPLATTQAAANATAQTRLAQLVAQRTVVIPATLPWNPALEVGDVISVEVASPDASGGTTTLTGPVQTATWPLGLGSMTAGVAVPRSALWP